MGNSYIPTQDGPALTWMQHFGAGISASPATYFLAPSDALNITEVVQAFADAYSIATNAGTRTSTSVMAKDQARNIAEQLCRSYAIQIKYNAGIDDQDKNNIGVRPVNPSRQPVNVPESSPMLNVVGATPGSQTVRYVDSATPTTAAKPFGALSIQIYVAIGVAPVADESAAQFYGAYTKNPVGIGFDHADNGKIATYFARWQSRRGDVGPWSLPVSMTIAA